MKLQISNELSLPGDVATQKLAFIGRTGSGKSYGCGVMVENMLRHQMHVVIIDPVGIWYGLRISAHKNTQGFAIPVLGGLHGDIPIEPTGGALAADFAVDTGSSVVLDVSQFESDSDKARFAADFANRFFFRKKAAPSPVHVVIEECQEFIPQNPQANETRMLHAFQRMWKLGRNFGIGGSLVTQRPQEVSKKALNQTELLFAFQMTGPQERKAIETWMSEKGVDLEIAGDLPSLKVGQAYAWSPQWLQFSGKISFSQKSTLNTSSTPAFGVKKTEHQLMPVDHTILAEKMKDTVERAQNDDPKHLRLKISKLTAELSKLEGQLSKSVPATAPKIEYRDRPILLEADRQLLHRAIELFEKSHDNVSSVLQGMEVKLSKFQLPVAPSVATRVFSIKPVSTPRPEPKTTLIDAMTIGNGGKRRILVALAQYPEGMAARRLSILSGISSTSGTWRNYLAELRGAGFVDGGSSHMKITEAGRAILGDFEPLPTGAALREYWCNRLGTGGKRRIFEVVCEAYPAPMSYEQVGVAAGVSPDSGTWRNYVAELRGLELLEGRGELMACGDLFNE